MRPQYTAIWRAEQPRVREWIDEIFGPYISDHVLDPNYEFVADNCILIDSFVYCGDPARFAHFKGKKAFLVHLYDEYYEGGDYAVYQNFRGVFRNFWSGVFNPEQVIAFPLGYTEGIRSRGVIPPLKSRQFVWTLLGECGKSSRPEAARALACIEPHFFYATDRVRGRTVSLARPGGFSKQEYRQLLLDTMFVPSPMGNANIECYRTFEALECGAIPVVEKRLTLDYYRNLLGADFPGLTVGSWREARDQIASLLTRPAELNALQERCIEWWVAFKRSYSQRVGEFLELRSQPDAPAVSPMHSGRTRIPLWRELELIRHHSMRAMGRRATRQVSRLFLEKRWRAAYTPRNT